MHALLDTYMRAFYLQIPLMNANLVKVKIIISNLLLAGRYCFVNEVWTALSSSSSSKVVLSARVNRYHFANWKHYSRDVASVSSDAAAAKRGCRKIDQSRPSCNYLL